MKTTVLSVLLAIALILGALLAADRFIFEPAPADMAMPTTKPSQLWTCGMHPQVLLPHPGTCPICHMQLTPLKSDDDSQAGKQKKVAYWWDPMLGPSSISDHPGKSAMGMDRVPVYENEVAAGPGVRIDPTVVQNMGIQTAAVIRQPLNVTIRATGMLEAPESGMHDVTLKLSGYIQKLYADTDGMAVRKGEPLFDLYSPDLQVAEQELISAGQSLKAIDAAANPAARADAQSLYDSARQKLRLWDIADADIDAIAAAASPPATVPFRAPFTGHMIDKMIVQGSAVQAGMKLMRIEDHSRLWLNAQVFEDQVSLVKVGQEVQVTLDSAPGKTVTGQVTFLYPHLDHMSRTEIVRCELENKDHALSPGMFATAEIVTLAVPDALVVPREAIIDTGVRQLAFIADPSTPGRFQPRDVKTGITADGGVVQILSGLAPGDQVVTSGQFLMDVESRTAEAIQKLRGTSPSTQPMEGK